MRKIYYIGTSVLLIFNCLIFICFLAVYYSNLKTVKPLCFQIQTNSNTPVTGELWWDNGYGFNMMFHERVSSKCIDGKCANQIFEGCLPPYKVKGFKFKLLDLDRQINSYFFKNELDDPISETTRFKEFNNTITLTHSQLPIQKELLSVGWIFKIIFFSFLSTYFVWNIGRSFIENFINGLKEKQHSTYFLFRIAITSIFGIYFLFVGSRLYSPFYITLDSLNSKTPKLLDVQYIFPNSQISNLDSFEYLVGADLFPKKGHKIIVRRDKNGKEVFLQGLKVNGQEISILDSSRIKGGKSLYGRVYIPQGEELVINGVKSDATLEFATHEYSGKADILLDNRFIQTIDLNSTTAGNKKITLGSTEIDHKVIIRRAPDAKEVYLQGLTVNGQGIGIFDTSRISGGQSLYGRLYIPPGQQIIINGVQSGAKLEFATHEYSGKADILLDDTLLQTVDLNSATPGNKKIVIDSTYAASLHNQIKLRLFQNPSNINADKIIFSYADRSPISFKSIKAVSNLKQEIQPSFKVNENQIEVELPKHWNSYRSLFSILIGLISTLILFWSLDLNFVKSLASQWKYLSIVLLLSCTIFLIYGIGLWPGGISYDGLFSWASATSNAFTNWQPFFYTSYLRFFIQIFEHTALVEFTQSFFTSLLIVYILRELHRLGLNLIYVLFCGVLILGCASVGLWSCTIFKDIPFTLILIFFSFLFFRSYCTKSKIHFKDDNLSNGNFIENSGSWWVLVSLAAFAAGLRHNGIVLLIFFPFFTYLSSFFDLKKSIKFGVSIAATFVTFLYGFGYSVGAHQSTNYPMLNMVWQSLYLQSVISKSPWNTQDASKDVATIQKFIPFNTLKDLGLSVIFQTNYNKFAKSQDITELSNLTTKLTFDNLPQALQLKMHDITETVLGMEYIWDQGWIAPRVDPIFFGSYFPAYIEGSEPLPILSKFVKEDILSLMYHGKFFTWRLWHFSALFPLIFLIIAFLLYGLFPASAIFSSFLLVQTLFLFVVLPANNLRYVYFDIIGGWLIPFLMIVEFQIRKRVRNLSD